MNAWQLDPVAALAALDLWCGCNVPLCRLLLLRLLAGPLRGSGGPPALQ